MNLDKEKAKKGLEKGIRDYDERFKIALQSMQNTSDESEPADMEALNDVEFLKILDSADDILEHIKNGNTMPKLNEPISPQLVRCLLVLCRAREMDSEQISKYSLLNVLPILVGKVEQDTLQNQIYHVYGVNIDLSVVSQTQPLAQDRWNQQPIIEATAGALRRQHKEKKKSTKKV